MSTELSGLDGVTRQDVLERLMAAGTKGMQLVELQKKMAPDWDASAVEQALGGLQRDGLAVEWNQRWMAIRHTKWIVGQVNQLEKGDALIRTGDRWEAGYFVSRRNLKGAIDRDRVLIRRVEASGRKAGDRLPEATIVRVLERPLRTVVGTLDFEGDRRWLVPFDPKVNLDLEVTGGDNRLEDQYVVVEVLDPRRGSRGPLKGRVTEVLGSASSPGVDVLVMLRHFRIPENFPVEALAEAERFGEDPLESDLEGRRDLTTQTAVTIDGESARDFDDAISVEQRPDGGFSVAVHIADVSHYVSEGDALDLEAFRRGTSVYFPDRAIPMLPETLSNGLCSLRPDVVRLTLSAFLEFSPEGEVESRRFDTTVIRSSRRLTYGEVRRLLEEPETKDEQEYGPVLTMLRAAEALARVLNRRRMDRGSIDFDLPEGDVILDEEGFTVGVRPGERNIAHRIIEELMIAANEAVAFHLDSHETPAVYRVHDPPQSTSLEELRSVVKPLGLKLEGDLQLLNPAALQALLKQAEGKPEEPFVSSLVLRAMQQAAYDPECRGHYALGSTHYTHFTSPIRRYPDLLVHRQLKRLLQGSEPAEGKDSLLESRLPSIAEHCSFTERRAERAERQLLQWKLVRLLAGRIGEKFSGRVTGVQPFGLFVQLSDYFVDGLVPIRSMADDFYVYEADSHRLIGQENGKIYRLADRVDVVLTGVDPRQRGLSLAIEGMPEPRQSRPRRQRRRSPR
ncbi:MAG: ribonuclease R [Thermoanaerobaculia bacterium]